MTSTFYSDTGVLLSQTELVDGKREGKCLRFYLSGRPYAVENYENDLLDKTQTYFYEDGTPKTILEYEKGKLHGQCLLYWPNGKMKREVFFRNGKKEGDERIWDEDGNLITSV